MGYCISSSASRTLDVWRDHCIAATGSSNTFNANGKRYWFEVTRRSHADGAATGTVHVFTDASGKPLRLDPLDPAPEHGYGKPAGSFRIEPDGSCKRAPKVLKNLAPPAGIPARLW